MEVATAGMPWLPVVTPMRTGEAPASQDELFVKKAVHPVVSTYVTIYILSVQILLFLSEILEMPKRLP